jgi:tetratricopeptide (TPR) repeat protein
MNLRASSMKSVLAATAGLSILASAFSAAAQSDLVPVRDITGGSSVFVLKGGSRSAPKRYVSKNRASRTKAQRNEATRRVSRQYVDLAKKDPRRTRTESVNPNRLAEIRRMTPDKASILFAGVGEYWMDRDDFKQASEFFGEGYQLDETNNIARMGYSESLALLGNEDLARDNIPGARSLFTTALKYNDKNAPAYFGLAEIAAAENNESDAVANYEKALNNDKALTEIFVPLGILYYQQGQIAKAEDLLTKALTLDQNNAQTQFFIGLIRYAQNNNAAALTAFNKAKTIDPAYEEAFHFAGETLSRDGKYDLAIPEYNKAIALKDTYFEAWFGLANAQFQLREYTEAIKSYNRALRLNNTNVEGIINVGDANRLLGNYNDAGARYRVAISFIERQAAYDKAELAELHSKVGFVIVKQCEVDRKAGRRCSGLDAALVAMEKAASTSPSSADGSNIGWAYTYVGNYDIYSNRVEAGRAKLQKAKTLLEQASKAGGANAEGALVNLASVLTALGDSSGAVNALKRAVDGNPRSAFLLNELGMAYMKASNFKDAVSQFKKAVGQDDKFAQAYFNLGSAEFKNGNLGEAKKAYKKLKDLKDDPDAAGYVAELETLTNGAVKG